MHEVHRGAAPYDARERGRRRLAALASPGRHGDIVQRCAASQRCATSQGSATRCKIAQTLGNTLQHGATWGGLSKRSTLQVAGQVATAHAACDVAGAALPNPVERTGTVPRSTGITSIWLQGY
jgi:hypothetical protein